MITLYHSPSSRSSTFIWLLEELGVEYDLVYCDIKRRSGLGAPDPHNLHPDKRVPALQHDNQLVTEQVAIALYLTDLFPESTLGRPINSPERGAYLSWLAFFGGEADPVYNARLLYGQHLDPMTLRDQARLVSRVDSALADTPYLMGQAPTAADLLLSGPFSWDPEIAAGNTRIAAWLKRLAERPAALRAEARDARPVVPA